MRDGELMMDKAKLLFLGADTSTEDAVRYAQTLGVYTIVTDYRLKEKVPAKQMADEAWMIDVKDTDALEARCREESVTAVFAGTHEFCLDQCRILCGRLGLPFYASDEGWRAARDKAFYKQVCAECGLDTPAWIRLKEDMDPSEIAKLNFPIVVKPTDSCAQQGLSVVHDPADLESAYKKAMDFSAANVVIAEEYIDGDELFVYAWLDRGKLIFLESGENFPEIINGRSNFGLFAHYGRYNDYIKNEIIPEFEKVTSRLGCENGLCLFQCIFRNGILYNLEFGYRLDGIRSWRFHKRIYGTSGGQGRGLVDNEIMLVLIRNFQGKRKGRKNQRRFLLPPGAKHLPRLKLRVRPHGISVQGQPAGKFEAAEQAAGQAHFPQGNGFHRPARFLPGNGVGQYRQRLVPPFSQKARRANARRAVVFLSVQRSIMASICSRRSLRSFRLGQKRVSLRLLVT